MEMFDLSVVVSRLRSARAATTLVFLVNGAGMGVWSVEIAEIKQAIGASGTAMGAVLFVFALAALAGMWLAARVSERYPVRQVCAVLVIGFVLSLVLPGAADTLIGLALALGVMGAANGGLDVAMNARASLIEAQHAVPIMSSFHAAWSLGGGLGAALAGGLVAAGFSPFAVMTLAAVIIVLPALAAGTGCSDLYESEPEATSGDSAVGVTGGRSTRLALLCAIAFCALLTEGALADWTSIYLKNSLGSNDGVFALGFVAFSAGMFVGRFFGDRLIAWRGRRSVGVVGATAAGASLATVLCQHGLGVTIACFTIIGLGLANIVPITFSLSGAAARSRPAGIAAAATSGYIGLLIGPVVIGAFTHTLTLGQALWLLVVTTGLMALAGARALTDDGSTKV